MRPRAPFALFAVVLLVACSGDATGSRSTPTAPDLSKTQSTPDPTLRWEVPSVSDGSLKIQGNVNALQAASTTTGTAQAYVFDDGVCGAKGVLFESNGGGDANMNPSYDWSRLGKAGKAACGGSPLAFRFDFPTGSVSSSEDANMWAVGDHDNPNRPGIAVFAAGTACGQLRYGSTDLATRNLPQVSSTLISPAGSKRIWRVQSTADGAGHHTAFCSASGLTYDMPFVVVVYEK